MSEGGWCELLSCTLLSVECVLYNRGVLRSLDSPWGLHWLCWAGLCCIRGEVCLGREINGISTPTARVQCTLYSGGSDVARDT